MFEKFTKKNELTKIITIFLVLTLNNFVFNCKHYVQIKGWAIETICAPVYAKIFMDTTLVENVSIRSFKVYHVTT